MSKFEVLNVSMNLIVELKPLIAKIAGQDRSLSEQIRRSASSIPLNISEASRRVGRDRIHSFRIAAGSASETQTALTIAQCWGYISFEDFKKSHTLTDRILAMLWRLTNSKS
jgi:four helix bundle protein